MSRQSAPGMSDGGLRGTLEALGWSQTRLALLLGCDTRTVRYWVAGKPIPVQVQQWLLACVTHQRQHPDKRPPTPRAWVMDGQVGDLSPEQLAALLDQAGWSQQGFARVLGVNRAVVGGWLGGKRPIPALLVAWVRQVLCQRARHPLPPPPPQWTWKYAREPVGAGT